MLQYDNCPNCFMPTGGSTVCPHCGYNHANTKPYPGVLPIFTLLNGRYLLGRVLGRGGFGITYVAKDITTNRICAIKEYMPAEYATRVGGTQTITPISGSKAQMVYNHGREKYIEEARVLAKLRDNPIVVDIWDFFQQNNTAYLVMEFLDGKNLRQIAKSQGGTIDADYMKEIFVTIASSLMEVHHKNILHRDLSPENIMIQKDGAIKLIDFGAARNYVSAQNVGMSILLKPGFAPPEQYDKKGSHGPWTDIYALCATFYNLVSGKPLIDAMFRYRGESQPSLAALGCRVTKRTSDVIERGMELDYRRRYKDFKDLLDDIDISISGDIKKKEDLKKTSVISREEIGKRIQGDSLSGKQIEKVTQAPYIAAVLGGNLHNRMQISTQDIFKIGRSKQSCQYVIQGDTNISRIHCYLRYDGAHIYLTDVSSNGTYLANGQRLMKDREYKIEPGTQFYIATQNHMLVVSV